MFKIKKLDLYVFRRFFTLFLMTFLICIFILLMQFLWKHVAELVGKGIGWSVLAEFFIYAIFTLVPMALPLAILLASLMAFGNLGENFELTAMKSAGISLFRIMRPLIIFIALVSLGAFYFSNYVLPKSESKLWALIFSLRQKSPEFDIPVGEFYSGINGVNIYIKGKDKGQLKNMMIYDFSNGFENASVTVADSGRVQFTADKKYLLLTLYEGESFENLQKQSFNSSSNSIPYRREIFEKKEILLDFNSSFNRYDESVLQDQHVSKNIFQLGQSIDSVSKIEEIRSVAQAKEIVNSRFFSREEYSKTKLDNLPKTEKQPTEKKQINPDTLFLSLSQEQMVRAANVAIEKARSMKDQISYNQLMLDDTIRYVRRHKIAWHRKFTLSFACLIFFFIGAPLGAIIRKGGLGMPVVVSVVMFIIYYIIDNSGYKMSREGIWEVYEGMWLSSAVLLPIGVFLTYKAVIDATLLSPEQYLKFFSFIKRKLYAFINNSPAESVNVD